MEEKQTQWQEFINRLESGLSNVKQNVDDIINDGTATEEQKRNAASDYAKQSLFLQQVQGMYDNGDYNNPTNTYGVNGTGAVYQSYKDSKYHTVTMTPWTHSGELTQGDTITAQVMTSDEISLVSTLEDIWEGTKTFDGFEDQHVNGSNLYIGCVFGIQPFGTGFHATLVDSSGYFDSADLAQYTRGRIAELAGVYIVNYTSSPSGILAQNTFSGTTQSIGYWSSGTQINAGYATIIEIEPEEMENPWDFYNDDILPNVDPNNAVFPDGYEPPGPYMEWHEVLTYDISCYKDAADETKIKLEFKQPVEKNGNPLKTTTIIFSENENNWAGTVTETLEASEGEIKITPFYLGECLSRRCNNEQ